MLSDISWGILYSGIISFFAFKKQSLSFSGLWGAFFVGAIIYAFGTLYWFGLLLAFFVSSSLLSHYKKERKKTAEDLFAKSGRRDILQVMANGGLGALLALFAHQAETPIPYMMVYLGMMATVNADTWATELGVLSKRRPRHIITWKRVEQGTSGGVSVPGTMAGLCGAMFIGGCGALFFMMEGFPFKGEWVWIGAIAGLAGAWMDSLLGATVQQVYACAVCQKETEKKWHCNQETRALRGHGWCTNDMVNMASSAFGGGVAWLLWRMFGFMT